jgi:hypothetical protein
MNKKNEIELEGRGKAAIQKTEENIIEISDREINSPLLLSSASQSSLSDAQPEEIAS